MFVICDASIPAFTSGMGGGGGAIGGGAIGGGGGAIGGGAIGAIGGGAIGGGAIGAIDVTAEGVFKPLSSVSIPPVAPTS
jgi:hypothetical protein